MAKSSSSSSNSENSGELLCVGTLEIATPKPVGFLCGSIPVPTDKSFHSFHSALLPTPQTYSFSFHLDNQFTCFVSISMRNCYDYYCSVILLIFSESMLHDTGTGCCQLKRTWILLRFLLISKKRFFLLVLFSPRQLQEVILFQHSSKYFSLLYLLALQCCDDDNCLFLPGLESTSIELR